jgi:hypothetical protein
MSPRSWPDGDDPIAVELRRAFDEAQLRIPDDVMLRRGWAAISGRPTWRPRGWSWFAGGMASTAAIAVACAALLWPRAVETPGRRDRATIAMVTGTEGEATMTTGAEGRQVTLDGGVEARLEGSSVMRIDRGDARVEEGAVRFSVPQRRPGQPFVVRAQQYRVVVLGTKFGVAVRGDKQVDVDVTEGVVEVWSDVRVARLERGESWHSSPAEAPPPATHAPVVAPEPAPPSAALAAEVELVVAPAPETHKPSRRHSARGSSSSRVATAAAAESAPVRTGPGAENAAYEIGKVLSERGQPASAVAAWRRYRADYPNGILRVEADVSIIETLARSGETDDALAEATDFLRRRPDSERRGEIARVAGDLYRARGDCRQAVGAYQIALSVTRSRDVAEAAGFHRAACLVRLGDAAGVDAARAYLRSHPDGRFKKQAVALVEQGVPANH